MSIDDDQKLQYDEKLQDIEGLKSPWVYMVLLVGYWHLDT